MLWINSIKANLTRSLWRCYVSLTGSVQKRCPFGVVKWTLPKNRSTSAKTHLRRRYSVPPAIGRRANGYEAQPGAKRSESHLHHVKATKGKGARRNGPCGAISVTARNRRSYLPVGPNAENRRARHGVLRRLQNDFQNRWIGLAAQAQRAALVRSENPSRRDLLSKG